MITELAQAWNFPAALVHRFDSYIIDDLPFLISAPVNILFFYGYWFWGREGVNISGETVITKLIPS